MTELKTSHQLARELLDLPELPVFVLGRWSGEWECPESSIEQKGWYVGDEWRTGEALFLR